MNAKPFLLTVFILGSLSSSAEENSIQRYNPLSHQLELVFQVSDIHLESTTAELHLWMAEPVDGVGQDQAQRLLCDPAPTEVFEDPIYGNRILYFNLTPALVEGATLEVRRKYQRTGWTFKFNPGAIKTPGDFDSSDTLFQTYTRSERWLEQTASIKELSGQIVQGTTDPWDQVNRIVGWIKNNCSYEYPPPTGRGSLEMLNIRRGDCGQYACLFINLARAVGIPSRFIAGLPIQEDGSIGAHAWAEVWFPGTGWIPVDPTGPLEALGTLRPTSIVMTKGPNISLPQVPPWANYENSEVEAGKEGAPGHTEFIQNACVAGRGLTADYSSRRRALFDTEANSGDLW